MRSTTCWNCLVGPVVTDPDSRVLVCASCGLVHDAGDAEFVAASPDDGGLDPSAGSLVHHGRYVQQVARTTCRHGHSGPLVPDPGSSRLYCKFCGVSQDAGDAEFVHDTAAFTDGEERLFALSAVSFFYHGC